jgi:surfeit locus 1 family protein
MVKKLLLGGAWVGVFCALVGLGVWQMQRLAWKEQMITRQDRALARSEPLPVDVVMTLKPGERDFQQVRLDGVFLADKALLLGMRPSAGRPGYQYVVPLRLTTGAYAGRYVPVVLGWVPFKADDKPVVAVPAQAMTLDGIARVFRKPSWVTPDNHPERGEWHTLDTGQIAEYYGLGPFLPFAVQARTAFAGVETLPPALEFRNDHLQYALTWFALAAIMIVMSVLRIRRGAYGQ